MNTINPSILAVLKTARWIVLNSSAGKDSQAMLDYVAWVVRTHGIDSRRIVVVHADLGRVEWPGTKELAEEQARHYSWRFEVVKRRTAAGQYQDLLQHIEARGMFPSPAARYCTSDHKRDPIKTLWTRLIDEAGPGRHVLVNAMGIRADESPARAKKESWAEDAAGSNGKRQVFQWLPIHGWNKDQVWSRIHASGVRHHSAYDLGMPRLSCCFCIYSPPSALRLAARHNPELLAQYVEVEKKIGHKFRVNLPLAEVQRTAHDDDAEGGCIDDWEM